MSEYNEMEDKRAYMHHDEYKFQKYSRDGDDDREDKAFLRKFNSEFGGTSAGEYEMELEQQLYTVDELLTFAGSFGKAQWFGFAAVLIANLGISMYYYHFPYLELMPRFSCKSKNSFGACSQEMVCENQTIKQWKIDWTNDLTIHNWITDSEDYGISEFRVGLIGSCYFSGILIGSILFQASDWIGRKLYFQYSSFFSIIVLYVLYFPDDINIKLIFGSLLGILSSIYLGSYAYLLEIVPKKSQNFMNYLFVLSENVIPVVIGSSYFYFGGKHWSSPFILSLILPVVGFIMLLFIPKSPRYLVDKGRIHEAEKELRGIAKTNGKNLPYEFHIRREEQLVEGNSDSLSAKKRQLLTSCSYFSRLLLIIMLFIHSNANQVMWGFYVKHLDINIFLINIIDAFTSTMVIIGTYWILKKAYVRMLIIILIIISLFCVIPLTIESYEILVWIGFLGVSACLKALSIMTYLAMSKMFDSAVVPTVLTISNLFTNIATIIAPQIAELPFPSSIFAFLSSSGVCFLLLLVIPISVPDDNGKEYEEK